MTNATKFIQSYNPKGLSVSFSSSH